MIEQSKYSGHWNASCDKCGRVEALISAEDFRDATKEIRKLGWTVTKNEVRNWWEHKCPDCASKPDATETVVDVAHHGYPEYERASGDAPCPTCREKYRDHAPDTRWPWLRKLCDDRLVKI